MLIKVIHKSLFKRIENFYPIYLIGSKEDEPLLKSKGGIINLVFCSLYVYFILMQSSYFGIIYYRVVFCIDFYNHVKLYDRSLLLLISHIFIISLNTVSIPVKESFHLLFDRFRL